MGSIPSNIEALRNALPSGVKLVAVSKTHSPEEIMTAYNCGQRIFGENRVQELALKFNQLPGDIKWHLIGHLQSNKVRQAVKMADMIESVDTLKLLEVINNESAQEGRMTDCLLQVHIASEETKSGFLPEELLSIDLISISAAMANVRICGLMGMATFTDNHDTVRSEFRSLKKLFDEIRGKYFQTSGIFTELSMGMSGDWQVAVEEGSTMIRVGTLIFGERIKR